MANIIRREPLTPLVFRKSMNDLFDNFLGSSAWPPFENISGGAVFPLDVVDKGAEYIVKANLPGVDKNNIDVQIHENVLSIRATYAQNNDQKDERYLIQERRMGTFSRAISFGTDIVTDKIAAQYRDGVLQLTIPKAEQVRPKAHKVMIEE